MRGVLKSPVGSRKNMERVKLEDGLSAYQCVETGGHYIPLQLYWMWLQKQPERLAHLPVSSDVEPPVEAEAKAKLCPETGTIMLRYNVGHDFDFYLDRSMTGGVWFDAGEWEALRSRQFHDEIHLIFTAPWQQAVRTHEREEGERERLIERFGEDLLEKLDAVKVNLQAHPHKEYALAYLHGES